MWLGFGCRLFAIGVSRLRLELQLDGLVRGCLFFRCCVSVAGLWLVLFGVVMRSGISSGSILVSLL